MSAKRRQETLERFSIPLEEDSSCSPSSEPLNRTRRHSTRKDNSDHNGDDGVDFDSQSDDDFLDMDDEDVFKTKCKGKAKARAIRGDQWTIDGSHEIPKVMLISLKGK
jgi:SWI/SNF-related matrix-associated actin-dependent regulator of chromatin subfamily A3